MNHGKCEGESLKLKLLIICNFYSFLDVFIISEQRILCQENCVRLKGKFYLELDEIKKKELQRFTGKFYAIIFSRLAQKDGYLCEMNVNIFQVWSKKKVPYYKNSGILVNW